MSRARHRRRRKNRDSLRRQARQQGAIAPVLTEVVDLDPIPPQPEAIRAIIPPDDFDEAHAHERRCESAFGEDPHEWRYAIYGVVAASLVVALVAWLT